MRFTYNQMLTAMQKCEFLVQLFDLPETFTEQQPNLDVMLSALFYMVPHLQSSNIDVEDGRSRQDQLSALLQETRKRTLYGPISL